MCKTHVRGKITGEYIRRGDAGSHYWAYVRRV